MIKTNLSSKFYRNLVFIIGILATIFYRLVVVFNNYSKLWVEIVWYLGTLGFIWYFAHRYRVEREREKLIEKYRLDEKIRNKKELLQDDREALEYILSGLKTSKARWNYIAIFVFSALAIVYAVINDIIYFLK
jgi:hypothetical protein